MTFDERSDERTTPSPTQPLLFVICGLIGIVGCVVVVMANLIGVIVHPDHGLVDDTISALAAGRYAVIMDIGLYAFALGILAAATGLRRLRRGCRSWAVASWLLTLMGLLVVVIGGYGEYGDNDTGGLVIHMPLVITMALTFTVSALLMAGGFRKVSQRWFWFNIACAVLWLGGAAIFWFSPTSIDGLIERGVGMVCVIWLLAHSKLLIDHAKDAATDVRADRMAAREGRLPSDEVARP